jgi:hypothetical protein
MGVEVVEALEWEKHMRSGKRFGCGGSSVEALERRRSLRAQTSPISVRR